MRLDEQTFQRVQQKLALTLPSRLQQLAGYNESAATALSNPPLCWLWWVAEHSHQGPGPQEPLYNQPCCNCRDKSCESFIALYCGGCDNIYWQEQRSTYELWCSRCAANDLRRADFALALEQYTGQSYQQARLLFEAREQIPLAWCQWSIRCWLERCQIITKSRIIATRCCNQIPWYPAPRNQRSYWRAGPPVPRRIGPIGKTDNPDQVLDDLIERTHRLTFPKRDKKKKGKKK